MESGCQVARLPSRGEEVKTHQHSILIGAEGDR